MWRYAPGIYQALRAVERLLADGMNVLLALFVVAGIVFGAFAVGNAMDEQYEAHAAYVASFIENPGNAGMR